MDLLYTPHDCAIGDDKFLRGSIFGDILNILHDNVSKDGDSDDFAKKLEKMWMKSGYVKTAKETFNRIMEVGVFYKKVECLLESRPESTIKEGMNNSIKKMLHKFYKTVANMNKETYVIRAVNGSEESATLRWALVWSREYTASLQYIIAILNATQQLSGIRILEILSGFVQHGNPKLNSLAQSIFNDASDSLCKMLWIWLILGSIKDPYNEFFIAENNHSNVDAWTNKYYLREELIPSTLSKENASIILETGKMISYIITICEEEAPMSETRNYFLEAQNEPHCGMISLLQRDPKNISYIIKGLCTDYSQNVLTILQEKYDLDKYFKGNYWYTFLALGNFGRYFLELIYPIYYKSVEGLEIKPIKQLLKRAVIATSPYHLMKERQTESDFVAVNWENVLRNDKLCDVLHISYDRGGPIKEIFSSFEPYHKKINAVVWKTQQMQYSLSNQKKILTDLIKTARFNDKTEEAYHKLFQLVSDLNQFMNHVTFYIMNDIIEEQWKIFENNYSQADTITKVIHLYATFLNNVIKMVSEEQNKEVSVALNFVHNLIRDVEKMVIQTEDILITNKNGKDIAKDMKAKATIFQRNFKDAVHTFLGIAARNKNNEKLAFLSSRINFNSYFNIK